MDELIPHTNAGSGADIGAFEVGESWTTGINWTPKFHTTIWKKTAATTDWNTASNWSTGICDLHLMCMLLFLRVQLAILKFQIPVRHQKILQ